MLRQAKKNTMKELIASSSVDQPQHPDYGHVHSYLYLLSYLSILVESSLELEERGNDSFSFLSCFYHLLALFRPSTLYFIDLIATWFEARLRRSYLLRYKLKE
jgi:hypothetical protein